MNNDKYIEWIDEQVRLIDEIVITEIIPTPEPDYSMSNVLGIARASLLANRDGLVRHEPRKMSCKTCLEGIPITVNGELLLTCNSFLDITKHLDKVMEK